MAQPKGYQTSVVMYDEDSYGQDPSSPSGVKLYHKSGVTVGVTQALEQREYVGGGRTELAHIQGPKDAGGALPVELSAESIGKLLKHALGTVNTTGTGPYVHTITIGALPEGFTLEKDFGANITTGRYEKINGCRINAMNVEFTGNGKPTVSFDIIGANGSFVDAPLDATPDDNGSTPFSVVEWSLEEGGSAISIVTAGKFSIANDLDASNGYAAGAGGVRTSLEEGKAKVTGEITARFTDITLLNKAVNGTSSSMKLIMTRGTGAGSAGNEYLEFEIASLKFSRKSPEISGPAGMMITLGFMADGTNALKAVLKNAVATL